MEPDSAPVPLRVLVMDDDEMLLEVSAAALRKSGFEVAVAGDGAAAVELYRQALEAGRRFAAVILDLNIPGAMGGREALERLSALDPGVRAFVSCGNPEDPVVLKFREHGFAGVIEKPRFYLGGHLSERLHALLS